MVVIGHFNKMALTSIPRLAVIWLQLEQQERMAERHVGEFHTARNEGFRVELKTKLHGIGQTTTYGVPMFQPYLRAPMKRIVMQFLVGDISLDNKSELID